MKKILFNDRYCLTQAVLEGRKTMTRRMIPRNVLMGDDLFITKSHYRTDDIVAVAQSYSDIIVDLEDADMDIFLCNINKAYDGDFYSVDELAGWNNKMFVCADLMPHQIRITGVRRERLQDISDEDCLKEGIMKMAESCWFRYKYWFYDARYDSGCYFSTPREAFAALIDKTSGRGTWVRNPWVFVYEFELVK